MSFDPERLAQPAIRRLRAYDPGHDLPRLRTRFGAVLAELGSNENALGPSPAALEAAHAALSETYRYPDPRCGALREALAQQHGVTPDQLVFGNGSHELLMQLAQIFAGADAAVMHAQFGFAVFPIAATAAGAPAVCVPALPRTHPTAPLGHDLDAMADALREDVRLIYLANPNNPTGTWFTHAALEAFLQRVPRDTLVVVDEAYGEYMQAPGLDTAIALLDAHPNLIVTRSFSKAYALAGLRIGYLLAHASVAAVLERLRESFNINQVAQAAARAALDDAAYLQSAIDINAAERARMERTLSERGFATLPSQTNFLLLDLGEDAQVLEQRLFDQAVIVRPMGGYGLPHTLRVSVGSRAENDRFLETL
ncbi:histidinol-phosphate transaminase [Oleiagrimonas sp. MCCC 1A03011]|uniref:histidinol-phosphate transaminase n=1 Tax=Oleiagrimonas sp. MCCC 1A03011 TaxID=1926883 RepID=UPI000DC5986B|nr:histidinol-phosphate transaminase [Oleiagrimonas sp. MCCC 1A03011]RAP57823.1 histidinol-phosphate transaminase [Oleiagrimonas sp. MCCC 1A03011]